MTDDKGTSTRDAAAPAEGLVAVRDTALWVSRRGRGRTILTLHGGPGFDATTLSPWLDPLSDDHELVYFDQRGQGRSAPLAPAAWSEVTHATWVEDADALRETLGRERVVLFGHSYGAFLALDYALAHRDRLDALILCDGAPSFAHGATVVANALARGNGLGATFLEGLAAPFADDAAVAALFRQCLPLYFHDPEAGRDFMLDTRFTAAASNRAQGALLPAWDVTERLGEIDVPTLVMVGDDDFLTPLAPCSEVLVERLPHARLAVVPRAGHFPFVEQREASLAAIRGFLASLAVDLSR